MDQVGYGANLEAMLAGKFEQLRQPRHRAVIAHDFADDADGPAACELDQVHRGLGVAGALQHAAWPRSQREYVAWLHQILWHGGGVGQDLDGFGPVGGADTGGDSTGGINADLKI